jgi:hypothetical protein
MLRFHRAACARVGLPATLDEDALDALEERQGQLGITFPGALSEWWAVPGGLDVLAGAQGDHPRAIAELGAPESWGDGQRDFTAEGLLVVCAENQGVCHWAVPLGEGGDPRVLIEVDGAPGEPSWREHAPSVSAWVAASAWDKAAFDLPLGLTAQDRPLADADLRLLEREFNSGPATFGWPGETVWRFEWQDQRVLVWAGADGARLVAAGRDGGGVGRPGRHPVVVRRPGRVAVRRPARRGRRGRRGRVQGPGRAAQPFRLTRSAALRDGR